MENLEMNTLETGLHWNHLETKITESAIDILAIYPYKESNN
jgi:hypothetical protein